MNTGSLCLRQASVALAVALLLGANTALPLSGASPGADPASECVDETDAVAAMPHGAVRFGDNDHLAVRIAASPAHRAAGMQHLCAGAIKRTPILFLFESAERPRFHMNNVHAPLDIIFVAPDGTIVAVERMAPAQTRLTTPPEPVIAALELAAGQAEKLGLRTGIQLRWDE